MGIGGPWLHVQPHNKVELGVPGRSCVRITRHQVTNDLKDEVVHLNGPVVCAKSQLSTLTHCPLATLHVHPLYHPHSFISIHTRGFYLRGKAVKTFERNMVKYQEDLSKTYEGHLHAVFLSDGVANKEVNDSPRAGSLNRVWLVRVCVYGCCSW